MDVRPWRDTLDWMTQPGGWLGQRDGKAELAYQALAGYETPNGWIAHGAPTDYTRTDGTAEPAGRRHVVKQRNALLQLALLHELRVWEAASQGTGVASNRLLQQAIVAAALTSWFGLRAKAATASSDKPYTEVDFAHSETAKTFFEQPIRQRLERLTAKLKLDLPMPPHAYDPDDEDCIILWGRLWTAGLAVAFLDWATPADCSTARDIARRVWCCEKNLYILHTVLPTGNRDKEGIPPAHAELRTRAAVAYAFVGSEAIRRLVAEHPWSLNFGLREISNPRTVGINTRYDGYNNMHFHLAVLSDCTYAANRTSAMPKPDSQPVALSTGDAETHGALAPEQRAALAQLGSARAAVKALRDASSASRRVGGPVRWKQPSRGSPVNGAVAALPAEFEPMSRESLSLNLVAGAQGGARWQPIATIELRRELGPDVAWLDLLVVALVGDRQVPLTVTLDDDEERGDGSGESSLLVLDEGAQPAVSADALRLALARPDALVGVRIDKGLGAFVVLEIDINGP